MFVLFCFKEPSRDGGFFLFIICLLNIFLYICVIINKNKTL